MSHMSRKQKISEPSSASRSHRQDHHLRAVHSRQTCAAQCMYASRAIHTQSLAPGYLMNRNCHRRGELGVESKARLEHRESKERRMGQRIGIQRSIEGNRRGRWMDLISE